MLSDRTEKKFWANPLCNHVDNDKSRVISFIRNIKIQSMSSMARDAYISLTRQPGCPLRNKRRVLAFFVTERKHGTMISKKFVSTKTVLRKLLVYGLAFLIVAGCATAPQAPPPPAPPKHPKRTVRPQQKPVDVKAQKRYYDQGLQYYSAEDYANAKEAFEEVVDLGPNTALGLKAKENLKKIEKILKTLDELESK
jgi:hypothetical protein